MLVFHWLKKRVKWGENCSYLRLNAIDRKPLRNGELTMYDFDKQQIIETEASVYRRLVAERSLRMRDLCARNFTLK